VSLTTTAGLTSQVLVVCGPVPQESLPLETFSKLVADARAGDTRTIVDLSPPRLNSALEGEPDIHWPRKEDGSRKPVWGATLRAEILFRGTGPVPADD